MKKLNFTLLIGAIILLSAFTIYTPTNYKIKDTFKIHFAGTDTEGYFEKFKGEVVFNENELYKSNFSLVIEVESISTGSWLRDKRARSGMWFDADKYPTISFKSTKFFKTTNGYAVDGFLTIHGIQKEVTIPFTFSNYIFKGNFKVNRIDYEVGTMEGFSKIVSNEIKIDFSVTVIKK